MHQVGEVTVIPRLYLARSIVFAFLSSLVFTAHSHSKPPYDFRFYLIYCRLTLCPNWRKLGVFVRASLLILFSAIDLCSAFIPPLLFLCCFRYLPFCLFIFFSLPPSAVYGLSPQWLSAIYL